MTHQSFSGRILSKYWPRTKESLLDLWQKLEMQNTIFKGLIRDTVKEYTIDQGQLMGAAMVYYTVLSIAPLVLLLLSIVGFVLRFNPDGSFEKVGMLIEDQFGHQFRNAIDDLLITVKAQAITVSGIGLLALLLGGSSAFRFLSYSFRRIWRPTPGKASLRIAVRALLRDHAVGVLFLLAIVGVLFISMILLNFIQIAQSLMVNVPALLSLRAIELQPVVSILIGTVVLLFVYRYLPPSRLLWSDVWLGSLMAAILWEVASILLRLYFDIRTSLIYGIVGSILVITIWVYTMCQVLFLGAEFCKVYSRWHKTNTQGRKKNQPG